VARIAAATAHVYSDNFYNKCLLADASVALLEQNMPLCSDHSMTQLCLLLQTIAEREALEQQEEAAEEEHKQRLNERQVRGSNLRQQQQWQWHQQPRRQPQQLGQNVVANLSV
jgi:hypothetical protein